MSIIIDFSEGSRTWVVEAGKNKKKQHSQRWNPNHRE